MAGYASASDWWQTLNCAEMVAAVGDDRTADMDNPYCRHYPGSAAVEAGKPALADAEKMVVDNTFAARYPSMGMASVLTLTWDAPSDGGSAITSYMVQRKYGDMAWADVELKCLADDMTTCVDTGLMSATTYSYQVRAVNIHGNSPWSMPAAMETTDNTPPMAVGSIDAVSDLMAGDTSAPIDVSPYFTDADGDTLTYTATSDMEMYVEVSIDGSMVTIMARRAGMATITVTADDSKGGTATQSIAVTVPNSAPKAVGSIDAVSDLMAGDTSEAMDVSMYFTDYDGQMLTYTATSDMEMYAMVAVDGSMLTITGVSAGMATITVTATDTEGATAMQTIMVTVPNSAPMAVGSIDAVSDLMAGDTSEAMDVSMYFSDADASDTLTYTATSDMEMYAMVAVDGSMLTITGVSAGMATITVTATDTEGATAMQTIMVTVPNSTPMAYGAIDSVSLTAGDMSDAMDVSMYFTDADANDTVSYSAESDDEAVATASVDGSMVTINAVGAGMATITVTATDAAGATAMQTIMVSVDSANMPPVAQPDLTASVKAGEMVMVQSTITDSDEGDTLSWDADSSNDAVATAEVNDTGMVTITGVATGMATITVTATDMAGLSASQNIAVMVTKGTLMDPSNVMASHVGTEVTVTWEGGDHADTFTVVLLRMNDDGTPDVFNTIFDRDVTSPHPVTMGNNLPGRYLVGVAAGQDNDDGSRTWTNWARSELSYQP